MNDWQRRTIAVFYHARGAGLPLRAANAAHLLSWGRYARHHVIYVNVAFDVPWRLLNMSGLDAVVFDALFCSMHWTPDYFRQRTALCAPIAGLSCPKIAIVQDEFTNIDLVAGFLESIGVTHVLTCAKQQDWATFYPRLVAGNVTFRTVLTGYVDETRLARDPVPAASTRRIAIGYRAGRNPFWLGHHGMLKSQVGEKVREAAVKIGIPVDIEIPEAINYLKGEQWYEFLGNCRAVIGVEGGASINDHDGRLRQAVDTYIAKHPGAGFDEVREACFQDRDGEVALICLSPRHFEAAMMKTAQILVEGNYNGVFKPWQHYIPLKADYSNIADVMKAVMDDTAVDTMTERAYSDLIADGRWSYTSFIRDLEVSIVDQFPRRPRRLGIASTSARYLLQMREAIAWCYIHLEAKRGFSSILSSLAATARTMERLPGATRLLAPVRQHVRRLLGLPEKRL